jgi:transposase-like protein
MFRFRSRFAGANHMTNRKVRRFTAERRAAFLAHLRRSGNQAAAARSLGFDRTVPEARRRRDAAFELECRAALDEASRRLAGAADPFARDGDVAFETIRGGRRGRVQIVATRTGKWSKRAEDLFLDILRDCGNVAAAARATGFSQSLIWQRRRKWPEFARRIEEALEEAELVLEFRLATHGVDRCGIDGEAEAPPGAAAPEAEAVPQPRFDPEFSLRFLKWREQKRRGKAGAGGRPGGAVSMKCATASCARSTRSGGTKSRSGWPWAGRATRRPSR